MSIIRPLAFLTVMAILPTQLVSAQMTSRLAAVPASPVVATSGTSISQSPTYQLWYRHPASQLWTDYCTSGNCSSGGHLHSSRGCSACNVTSAAGRENTACDQSLQRSTAACASDKCQCGQNCNKGCGLDLLDLFGFALCTNTHRANVCSGERSGASGTCGNNTSYAHSVPSIDESYDPAVTFPPVHVDPPSPKPDADPTPAFISPPTNAVPRNVVPKKVAVPQEIERSIFVSPVPARPVLRLSDFIKT